LQADEALSVDQEQRQDDAAAEAGGSVKRPARIKLCPRCSSADYVQREGCWVCDACGFSRCG
jgi:ribonucleoside-diphosphate reductase alpha chain